MLKILEATKIQRCSVQLYVLKASLCRHRNLLPPSPQFCLSQIHHFIVNQFLCVIYLISSADYMKKHLYFIKEKVNTTQRIDFDANTSIVEEEWFKHQLFRQHPNLLDIANIHRHKLFLNKVITNSCVRMKRVLIPDVRLMTCVSQNSQGGAMHPRNMWFSNREPCNQHHVVIPGIAGANHPQGPSIH